MNYYDKYQKYKFKYLEQNVLKSQQYGGFNIPLMGFGTWQSIPNNNQIEKIIYEAIKIGYKCFDCAYNYNNEEGIGRAFKKAFDEGIVKRTDLFIIGKAITIEQFKISLEKLQIEYFDLALFHFYSDISNWELMIKVKLECLTNKIGLSNIYINKLKLLIQYCDANNIEKPTAIENEINLFTPEEILVNYCNTNNIKLIGYTPLGQKTGLRLYTMGRVKLLTDISIEIGCTIPQLILLWGMKRNITVIPTSSNVSRMTENFFTTSIYEKISSLSEKQISDISNIIGFNSPLTITAQTHKDADTDLEI
jgi:diketogulonate reductase-like aldo/keto reductase